MPYRWNSGLQAEAAQHGLIVFNRPDDVGTARNAIAVRVLGISQSQDVRGGNGFKKAEADHLRSDSGTEHCLGVQRAVAQVGGGVGRTAQVRDFAAGQRHLDLLIVDLQTVFSRMSGQAEVLQLPTVSRIRQRRQVIFNLGYPVCRRTRNRNPQEHGNRIVVRLLGRMTSTVLDVAPLAGSRIEKRPQPIRCQG